MPPLHRLDFALRVPVVNPRFVPSNNLPHKLVRKVTKMWSRFLTFSNLKLLEIGIVPVRYLNRSTVIEVFIFLPRDAMLIARSLLSAGVCPSVCPSVCLSVTFMYRIQAVKDIVKLLSRPGRLHHSNFSTRAPIPNSKGNPFSVGVKNTERWVGKFQRSQFWEFSCIYANALRRTTKFGMVTHMERACF